MEQFGVQRSYPAPLAVGVHVLAVHDGLAVLAAGEPGEGAVVGDGAEPPASLLLVIVKSEDVDALRNELGDFFQGGAAGAVLGFLVIDSIEWQAFSTRFPTFF